MAFHYVDTSALLKRYLPELGSKWVTRLLASETVCISLLTISEVASALARRALEGSLSQADRDLAFDQFMYDVRGFAIGEVSQEIARDAATMLLDRPAAIRLRALDAIHLASARSSFSRAQQSGMDVGTFVTADRPLLQAAQWAGLPTVNPEDYP